MPIIDQVQQQAAQAQPTPEQAQPGQKGGPSKEARSVILAVYGMLYDKRVALGEKIGEQLQRVRDPVAILANNAFDLVVSASEKISVQLDDQSLRFAVAVTLRRLTEIAEAVGIELSEQDGAEASEMINERMAGGAKPPEQAQPGAMPPGQPMPEQAPPQGAMA